MEINETDVYEKVVEFCHDNIACDGAVKEYLRKRFVSDEMISKFKIGAWPRNIYTLMGAIDPHELGAAYLLKNDETTGQPLGKFRNHRIIFPIYDAYGSIVSIQGRTLHGEEEMRELRIPKYLHTRFPKRLHLFGLNLVKDIIRRENKVLVVEGFLDVIKAHQYDMKTVVAALGTALTREQILLLARYTDRIFLGFDNDEAGTRAVARAMKFKRDGVELIEKRVPLPYKDLDEYLDSKRKP